MLDVRFSCLADDEKAIVEQINDKIVVKWFILHHDSAWVVDQVRRAILYYQSAGREPKTSRGWSSALTGWLNRSKDWQVEKDKKSETMPIHNTQRTIEEINEQQRIHAESFSRQKNMATGGTCTKCKALFGDICTCYEGTS